MGNGTRPSDPDIMGNLAKCTLYNFSDVALTEVSAKLRVSLWSIKKVDNGIHSENMLSEVEIEFPYFQTRKNENDYFYISNRSPYISVLAPDTKIELIRAGSSKKETVNLLVDKVIPNEMAIFPVERIITNGLETKPQDPGPPK